MTDRPLAKPAGLTDEGLFKARTEKVMFVNPPGSEHYARVHSFGRDTSPPKTIRTYGSNGWSGDYDRKDLRHLRGFGDSLAIPNRPVK